MVASRLLVGLVLSAVLAQCQINGVGGQSVIPTHLQSGSSLPGTCAVGDEYFLTTAAAGQNKNLCTATNTWTTALPTVPLCGSYIINFNETTLAASSSSGAAADVTLFTLPASSKIQGVSIKSNTAFTGTAISSLTVSVGVSGSSSVYTGGLTYDLMATVGNTNKLDIGGQTSSTDASHAVLAHFVPTNAALSALTAGQVKLLVCVAPWISGTVIP